MFQIKKVSLINWLIFRVLQAEVAYSKDLLYDVNKSNQLDRWLLLRYLPT